MENFYMTLLSNSSTTLYPENKTSGYKVQLPKRIQLKGKWVVALAEIHFPYTFEIVTPKNNEIYLKGEFLLYNKSKNFSKTLKIDTGNYEKIESIITAINRKFTDHYGNNLFTHDPLTKRVTVDEADKGYEKKNDQFEISDKHAGKVIKLAVKVDRKITDVQLGKRLAIQCGFPPEKNILSYKLSPHTTSLNMGMPQEMLIYFNLVEPQIIGHTCAPIIKIISVTGKKGEFGEIIHHEFPHRNYLPIIKNEFQTVEIYLRTNTGEMMPFSYGVSTVVLHFKRVE